MKTILHQFELLISGGRQKEIIKCANVLFFLITMLSGEQVFAQNTINKTSINDVMNCWLLGGFAVVFLGTIIYALNKTVTVLRENGKELEFSFPMFRGMAQNGKTVTILILVVVFIGIVCALNY